MYNKFGLYYLSVVQVHMRVFPSTIFVFKFAKDLQPCKLDAIAAIATFALGAKCALAANSVQIHFFIPCFAQGVT